MLSTRAVHIDPDVHYYPTKTPARNAKSRGENAYQGAMTIQNAKGKVNIMRTPFQPKTVQPQRMLKDALGSAKAPSHPITRPSKPLADKTPFANRVLNNYNTPAPDQKHLKLLNVNKPLELYAPTPDSGSARASSTRKHLRAPKSTADNFKTPANQGNYWDVSEDEIVLPEMEQVEEKDEVIDGGDEIEYMPPNTLNIAYQPPFDFDLPNYELLGQAALRSVYHYPDVEVPPPTFEFQLSDNDFMRWDSLSLPSLNSDDDSRPSKQISSRTAAKSTTTATSTSRATSALVSTTSRVTSRPATSASTRRPATSASTKAPTAKPTARPASTAGTRTTNTTSRSIVTPSTTCKPPTSTVSRAPVSTSTTSRVTSRPATSASTRRPATSVSTKAPIAKPTARPASTAGTRATNTTSRSIVTPSTRRLTTTTTTRPTTAQSTTTTRNISRPVTSASTSRPLTSASVRTAASSASTVKSTVVAKSMPGFGVGSVKKSVTPRVTALAATTRNKANTAIKASVPKSTSSRAGGVKVAGNARVGSMKTKADIGKGRMVEDEGVKASVEGVKEESAQVKEAAEVNEELKNDGDEEASLLEAGDVVGVGEGLGEETSVVREKQVLQTTMVSEEVGGIESDVVNEAAQSGCERVP